MADTGAPAAQDGDLSATAICSRARQVIGEIRQTISRVDPVAAAALLAAIAAARRVFFDAQGRSGLVARALAMRWMHLGMAAHVTGEATTPAIGEDDLLVCLSASGRTGTTLAHAETARQAGARVVVITATATSPLAEAADLLVLIPARTEITTAQHAGSLFEQTSLILGDVMCAVFAEQHAIGDSQLGRRHANLL
jgi:6-phospho-3-hexuloisomerase